MTLVPPVPSGRFFRVALAAALVVATLTGPVAVARGPAARADVVTASGNNLRDGWDPAEPGLRPAVLRSGRFGQLFSARVNGQVFAQPVVAGSTLVVATQNDWVYGLNAVTGAIDWSLSLGTPWPSATAKCTDVTPNVGVMSTPAYDPRTGVVYLVAEVIPPGANPFHPAFFVHALNARTGAEVTGWPVRIQGTPVNDPTRQFDALSEWQRPGLLLLDGSVYAAFGSHCDIPQYTGYVAAVSTTTRAQTLWSDESGLTDSEGGIWQSGSGLMADGKGRIFFASGNGVSPVRGPGSNPPGQLADAVVRLGVRAGGSLAAEDFFSPANAPVLDAHDGDFGSGGPVGLPFGTLAHPHLLVQAGKDGRVFLLDRDNLGGREQGRAGTDKVVSVAGPFEGEWSHPAAYGGTGTLGRANASKASDFVYNVGAGGPLRALRFGLNRRGAPVLSDVANSAGEFGFGSGAPVVTSDGTNAASSVVWEVYAPGGYGAGTLEAFLAVPPTSCSSARPCTLRELWSAPIGKAAKFTIPATDDGRVYVGTASGRVIGFGSPDRAPLTGAAPVNFGQVPVGSESSPHKVTVAATTTIKVTTIQATSVGGPDPFTTGAPTDKNGIKVTLPVTLRKGDTLTIPVSVDPIGPGGVTGSVDFASDSANFPVVSVPLAATGTKPGFYARPAALAFHTIPVGTSVTADLVITNGGAKPETVSSVTPPSSPFTVSGLPSGTVAAGRSVTATVTYQPTAVTSDSSAIVINAGDGTSLTVALSGAGAADVSQLTPAPASVSFGSVPVGTQVTRTIDLTNTGNLPATITTTAAPPVPFGHPSPVPADLPLNPGYDIEVPVTFTPPGAGAVSGSYGFTWTDVAGTHSLSVPVTATGVAPASGIAVPPPGGGWTFNGAARMSGTALSLNPVAASKAGSAVYSVPAPSDGLHAAFTVSMGGGSGGEGMTLALLDATTAQVTALGQAGQGLGWAGQPGVAVALVTHPTGSEPGSPFVGIATGSSGNAPVFAATSTSIPDLRTGTHAVGVSVSGQTVTVTIDAVQVLSATLPDGTVPPSVLVGFTSSTSNETGSHVVSGVSLGSGGQAIPPPGGGWQYNGTAAMNGADNLLTPAVPDSAGSVVYPVAVKTAGLDAVFNVQMYAGNYGYGLTFALLDPARSTAASLGANGRLLGFGGLAGTATILVSGISTRYPADNLIGVSRRTRAGLLGLQNQNRNIEPLRSGTHTVQVRVVSDVLEIWLDGKLVIQQPEPQLPGTALLAFTAGTGARYQNQVVRSVAISAAG